MKRLPPILVGFLFLTAAYVFAWPSPSFIYFGAVVGHILGGLLLTVVLAFSFRRIWRDATPGGRIGWLLLVMGAILGVILIYKGTPRSQWTLLYVHVGVCLTAGVLLAAAWAGKRGFLPRGFGPALLR